MSSEKNNVFKPSFTATIRIKNSKRNKKRNNNTKDRHNSLHLEAASEPDINHDRSKLDAKPPTNMHITDPNDESFVKDKNFKFSLMITKFKRMLFDRKLDETRFIKSDILPNSAVFSENENSVDPEEYVINETNIKSQMLKYHNLIRENHSSPPLVWSDELSNMAQKYCDQFIIDQFGLNFPSFYGKNLYISTKPVSLKLVCKFWYDDGNNYKFKKNTRSKDSGIHQMVWANTQQMGCGCAFSGNKFIVLALYNLPGNAPGFYSDNVKEAKNKYLRIFT